MLQFRRISAHYKLQGYIQGYWSIQAPAKRVEIELVPDGFPELFFVQKGLVALQVNNGEEYLFPETGVIGQISGRRMITYYPGSQAIFIKLHPWALSSLLQVPSHLLKDQILDLKLLKGGGMDYYNLSEELSTISSLVLTAAQLDDFFLDKLGGLSAGLPFIRFSVEQIFRHHGVLPIHQLSGKINVSRRYIEKAFQEEVGLSPKKYALLIRIKKASLLLQDQRFKGGINQVSSELGFYDQSHFLKAFKTIVGCSPKTFLKEKPLFSSGQQVIYLNQWDYS